MMKTRYKVYKDNMFIDVKNVKNVTVKNVIKIRCK